MASILNRGTDCTPVPACGCATAAPLFDKAPAMREVAERVAEAARTRTGVLIVGEPGAGRRFVAGLIDATHAGGQPAPRVVLDCAALPAQSMEEQLFGSKPCLLAQCAGGTLLLLNVADMPERVQARLARVLRDGQLAVDGHTPVPIDIRPIACVDPTFDAAVEEGRVRADLHRMLSRIRIDVPPLRARREDIPGLAEWFVAAICADGNIPGKRLTPAAQALLAELPYPGNARELRTLLEALVARHAGPEIDLAHLLLELRFHGSLRAVRTLGTLRAARMEFEREYILEVLRQRRGRIGETARVLGIERANLYRKMRKLRIASPDATSRES
jgi:DNA-binding NtrC family response regulator